MRDLTGFQRDRLYVITGLGEPHGLAIRGEPKPTTSRE